MDNKLSPRQHLILTLERNRYRADNSTRISKAQIFAACEFLSLPSQKRAEQITQMQLLGMPSWMTRDSFRAAKALGFVSFVSLGPDGFARALVPGEIGWSDPTREALVVELTELGRELLRSNALLG